VVLCDAIRALHRETAGDRLELDDDHDGSIGLMAWSDYYADVEAYMANGLLSAFDRVCGARPREHNGQPLGDRLRVIRALRKAAHRWIVAHQFD